MKISLILAMSENRVIGRDGELPWHLPADLKRFKKLTLGHVVIMGRKTHESIVERLGRPLPKRRSLVLSRVWPGQTNGHRAPDVEVVSSLGQALELAAGETEVFIIGGAAVFAEALPLADRVYLTLVHSQVEGDVSFADFDARRWQLVSEERHEANRRHAYAFSFLVYEPSPPKQIPLPSPQPKAENGSCARSKPSRRE